MRYITDAIVAIVIMAIVVNALMAMIAPFAPYIIIGAVIVFVGMRLARRAGYF